MSEVIVVIVQSTLNNKPTALIYEPNEAGANRASHYAELFRKQDRLISGPDYSCVLSDEKNGEWRV